MSLLYVLAVILAVGFVMYLVHTYATAYIQPPFLKLADIVAVVGVIIWLLYLVGLFDFLRSVRIGHM